MNKEETKECIECGECLEDSDDNDSNFCSRECYQEYFICLREDEYKEEKDEH